MESSIEKPSHHHEAVNDSSSITEEHKPVLVNECSGGTYNVRLLEIIGVDSNAFTLEIDLYDQLRTSKKILDLPPGRSKIMDCTEDFVIVGFACGGPCYADVFISLEGDKPNETYGYSNRMLLDASILAYIKGEEFERQRIRNLKSGIEVVVDISKCVDAWGSPCLIDSMYFSNKDTLILDYSLPNGASESLKYHVGVENLLKI